MDRKDRISAARQNEASLPSLGQPFWRPGHQPYGSMTKCASVIKALNFSQVSAPRLSMKSCAQGTLRSLRRFVKASEVREKASQRQEGPQRVLQQHGCLERGSCKPNNHANRVLPLRQTSHSQTTQDTLRFHPNQLALMQEMVLRRDWNGKARLAGLGQYTHGSGQRS